MMPVDSRGRSADAVGGIYIEPGYGPSLMTAHLGSLLGESDLGWLTGKYSLNGS